MFMSRDMTRNRRAEQAETRIARINSPWGDPGTVTVPEGEAED
jgi:hypothetical protein